MRISWLATFVSLLLGVPALAQVSIDNVTLAEGDTDYTEFVFTASVDASAPGPVWIHWQTVAGSGVQGAKAGIDYVELSDEAMVDPGASVQIPVQVVAEYIDEYDEYFYVRLTDNVTSAFLAQGQAWITNDDVSMGIAGTTVGEGDEGLTTVTLVVSLDDIKNVDTSATWSTVQQTAGVKATAGVDYVVESGTVTIPPGLTQATVDVHVIGDGVKESQEPFHVVLSDPVACALSPSDAVVYIGNDDAGISVDNPPSVSEGDSGTTSIVYTITLDMVENDDFYVDYETIGGIAIPDVDYQYTSGTAFIAQGDTWTQVTVPVFGDLDYENNEQVQLHLSNPAGAETFTSSIGYGQIDNDDPFPTASVLDTAVLEGDSGLTPVTITFQLSAKTIQTAAINYATADGTATTADGDYNAVNSGSASFPAGTTTVTKTVFVRGDTAPEGDETFEVAITNGLFALVDATPGTVTILEDDNAPPVLTPGSPADGSTYPVGATVNLDASATDAEDGDLTADITWSSSLDGPLVPGDNLLSEGIHDITASVTDSQGQSDSQTVQVTMAPAAIALQTYIEGDDADTTPGSTYAVGTTLAFTYEVSNPGAFALENIFLGDTNATPELADDFVPTYVSGDDGNGILDVGETWMYAADVAAAPGTHGHASIASGFTLGTGVEVEIGDAHYYTGNAAPVAANDAYVTDEGALLAGNVLLNDIDPEDDELTAVLVDDAANGTLTLDADGSFTYEPNPGFALTESFTYVANDGTSDSNVATVTIEVIPELTISLGDTWAVEQDPGGGSTLVFPVTLNHPFDDDVTFEFTTTDGTASSADYFGHTQTQHTIPAGQTGTDVLVVLKTDWEVEDDETVIATLSNVVGATVVDGEAVGTIVDNDTVTLSVADTFATEQNPGGGSTLVFTVSLNEPSAHDVTFELTTTDQTATAADDYIAHNHTVHTIPAGETSLNAFVFLEADWRVEPTETMRIDLSNVTGADLVDGEAIGTILDNDTELTISLGDTWAVEQDPGGGSTLVFPVTLNHPFDDDVTFEFTTTDGTASSADYFGHTQTQHTIPAGQTGTDVLVVLKTDWEVEDDETVIATLSNVVGATVVDGEAVGTIVDNDVLPELSVPDVNVLEGDQGNSVLTFLVDLSEPAGPVTADFHLVPGTALPGDDYVDFSGTLSIPAGNTIADLLINVVGDWEVEPDETFTLVLDNITGATPSVVEATGTILNDDILTVPPPANEIQVCTALDGFGASVAARDGNAALGAPGSSAAISYELLGDAWSEIAALGQGSGFGAAVSVDAGTIAVGGDDIVVLADTDGTVLDTLVPAAAGTGFGAAVALDWDVLAVGAPGEGAVYVFRDTPGGWVSDDMLLGAVSDAFGTSVALHDGLLVVGAPGDDAGGTDAGALHVFEDTGAWDLLATLDGDEAGGALGTAVAVDATSILGGAPGVPGGGGAYAWATSDLSPLGTLSAADGSDGDALGTSVALSEWTAALGAPNALDTRGAVVTFAWDGDAWIERDTVRATDATTGDHFGAAVGLDDAYLWVGAPDAGSGCAYVYVTCTGLVADQVGTAAVDVLFGTDDANVFAGLGSDDIVFGEGGDDTVCGGSGDDVAFGDDGDDLLLGGNGDDYIEGGAGSDLVFGGTGDDALFGDSGGDTLRGGPGEDLLWGDGGNDNALGGAGADILITGLGDDCLDGGPGRDLLLCGKGTDTAVNTRADLRLGCEIPVWPGECAAE